MIRSWLVASRAVTIEVTPFVKAGATQLPSCLRLIASAVPGDAHATRGHACVPVPLLSDRAVKSPGARADFRAPNVSPIGERESSNSRGSRRRTSHEQVLKGSVTGHRSSYDTEPGSGASGHRFRFGGTAASW